MEITITTPKKMESENILKFSYSTFLEHFQLYLFLPTVFLSTIFILLKILIPQFVNKSNLIMKNCVILIPICIIFGLLWEDFSLSLGLLVYFMLF